MKNMDDYIVHTIVQQTTSLDEATLNHEIIKPVASVVIEILRSEGFSYS